MTNESFAILYKENHKYRCSTHKTTFYVSQSSSELNGILNPSPLYHNLAKASTPK